MLMQLEPQCRSPKRKELNRLGILICTQGPPKSSTQSCLSKGTWSGFPCVLGAEGSLEAAQS